MNWRRGSIFQERDSMTIHPLTHATTEGPLGFPVTDRQAFALDAILKALPQEQVFHYRKAQLAQGPSEVLPGERSDVSWISTEDPDRTREVVVARGMNDSQFKHNPIVTLQHAYWLPPVGKSLWRKVVKVATDTAKGFTSSGVKAKTQYPFRPAEWAGGAWPESEVRDQKFEISLTRFTPLEEIEKALCRKIHDLNLATLADRATRNALDRLRGRV